MAQTEGLFNRSETKTSNTGEGQTDCVIPAPIDRLGEVGLWIRERLLACSLYGTPLLVVIQRHRTPILTRVMKAAGFLGEEEFYIIITCTLLWVVESRMAVLFLALMAACFYVANSLKNILRLPRPAVPPVKPLEIMHDWAFPSHHSLNGVALPWFLYFYISEHWHVTTLSQSVLFLTICVWSCLMMFDRLYLGVHTPADVITGGFLGCAVLAVFMQVDTLVEPFIVNSGLWLLLLWAVVLTAAHPCSGIPNITKAETVAVYAAFIGFSIATLRRKHDAGMLALLERPISADTSLTSIIAVSIGRVVIGLPLLELYNTIAKAIMRPFFSYLLHLIFGDAVYMSNKVWKLNITFYSRKTYRLPGNEKVPGDENEPPNDKEAPLGHIHYAPTFTDNNMDANIPVRLVVFMGMGWLALEGMPRLFQLLHLTC